MQICHVLKKLCLGVVLVFALFFALAGPAQAEGIPYATTADFEQKVLQSSKPVLVQFDAKWCPYCRKMQPILQEFHGGGASGMTIFKIDIDNEPMLADTFEIRTLPTMLIFHQGREVARQGGALTGEELRKWVSVVLREVVFAPKAPQ